MDNKLIKLLFLFTNLIYYETPEDGSGARSGGSGEIRTHEGLAPLPVFKTGAFNRSATLPSGTLSTISAVLTNIKMRKKPVYCL